MASKNMLTTNPLALIQHIDQKDREISIFAGLCGLISLIRFILCLIISGMLIFSIGYAV